MDKTTKLATLAALEGHDSVIELLQENAIDSVVPGICRNTECDYTVGVEPDCWTGWCEACDTQTVASCMRLADVI